MFDPSEVYRPDRISKEKQEEQFRVYEESDSVPKSVFEVYKQMHTNQTVDFVKEQQNKWLGLTHFEKNVHDALIYLNELIDESDPDVDMPNIMHAFQTAEAIRFDYPELDWLHLTGLIHDLGKIMAFYGEPQWAVVGDTFVVGCEWANSIVYRNNTFDDNPDSQNKLYQTPYGIYEPNCGLDKVMLSWGHDEYLFHVLERNGSKLPTIAHKIIRYHSFYPWHTGGDYMHLCNEDDERVLKWVQIFNKYDLYTKSSTQPNIEQLWPYYNQLIEKYIPGILKW